MIASFQRVNLVAQIVATPWEFYSCLRAWSVIGRKIREIAHLDCLVPSGRDDDWVHWVWREPDAGDPLGVTILSDVKLALSEGVP
jgi:hypothetical protein